MESLNNFLIQKPRPLPVIVAVDRSGSTAHKKTFYPC